MEVLVDRDHAGLLQAVKDGIRMCYSAGFRKNDVALLSYRDRESSRLLGYDQLGPHTLRAPLARAGRMHRHLCPFHAGSASSSSAGVNCTPAHLGWERSNGAAPSRGRAVL